MNDVWVTSGDHERERQDKVAFGIDTAVLNAVTGGVKVRCLTPDDVYHEPTSPEGLPLPSGRVIKRK